MMFVILYIVYMYYGFMNDFKINFNDCFYNKISFFNNSYRRML